ncbi:MAG: hypothetical protein GY847_08700 [Proteobacteria bacterium]|nr:hypothetical protein [Pseudomonadota bacterium]
MKAKTLILIAAAVAAGCSGAQSGTVVQIEENADTINPFIQIDIAEDRRVLDLKLTDLAGRTDVEMRERIAMAVGRIGDPDGASILLGLLNDVDPRVRDAAAFASGLLGDRIPPELKTALIAGLESEKRPEGFTALLDALGRVGSLEDVPRLVAIGQDKRPEVRAAAIRAIGLFGRRGVPIPDEIVKQITAWLTDKAEPVRFMSAFALYHISNPLPGPRETVTALEKSVVKDDSSEVRAYALRALAKRGGLNQKIFDKTLKDADEAVVSTAILAIGLVTQEKRCALAARALGAVATRLDGNPYLVQEIFIHTARASLEAAIDCRETSGVKEEAARIVAKIRVGINPEIAGSARVLCLARLIAGADDLALLSCDKERSYVGKRMVIQRLGSSKETSDQNIETLIEMTADPDLHVAIEAFSALVRIPRPAATKHVLDALGDNRQLVVSAVLDAIAAFPMSFRNVSEGVTPRAREGVTEGIGRVVKRFEPFQHVYQPIISSLSAIEALGDPAAEPILRGLAADPRPPIRHLVLQAYDAIHGIEPPKGLPALAPIRPVPPKDKDEWRNSKVEATIRTTRGVVWVDLHGETAPVTVGNFVSLAKSGYFDDTEIHRVVPNFVVQAGDPTGTGLGEPGYAIRCEASKEPYERGTVGMALSGKDTGGSQFFIALSRQPHLDGNYTAFGKVSAGMSTVDLIEEGDRILGVSIEIE